MSRDSLTLKKGETLEQIAKKHQLKVEEVWDYGPNNKLKKTRGSWSKCVAGDTYELPPNKAERKAALEKVEGVQAVLKLSSDQNYAAQTKIEHLLSDLERKHKDWVKEIQDQADDVNFKGNVADLANMLIGVATSIKGFVAGAREVETLFAERAKDLTKGMEEIDKAVHSQMVGAWEFIAGPFSPLAGAAASTMALGKSSDNAFVSALGTAADWFGQITSPSGVAKFLTGVDGKLAEARREVDDNYAKMKSTLLRKQNAMRAEFKSIEDTRNTLERAYQNMKQG